MKNTHEIRDPIHGFISYSAQERLLIDSEPFQRLRHIHQLATTNLIYPGACHKRFEHSLGVMELATQIFRTITSEERLQGLPSEIYDYLPDLRQMRFHWEKVIRLAALCHDFGHLPFSHAAEKELLPLGKSHERISWDLITHPSMEPIWEKLEVRAEQVAKIAVGKKEAPPDVEYSIWETLVAEIIVGDVFGADRMDYLLRDSLHTGVAYGRFDHRRLISTLHILPKPPEGRDELDQSLEPALGIENGGLQAAESLLMARYLMFTQLYLHPVRRIYDIHLKEYMLGVYGKNSYPVDHKEFLSINDNDILSAMAKAARDSESLGHEPARRIITREHFKKVYQNNMEDVLKSPSILKELQEGLAKKFDPSNVRLDEYNKPTVPSDFPVLMDSNKSKPVSAMLQSPILNKLPPTNIGYIFVEPKLKRRATKWVDRYRKESILTN